MSATERTTAVRGGRRPFSVAPMMDRTDRHFRWLVRRISRHALLYTEMVTTGAILRGDRDRLLGFDEEEHPLALQLGGDDPRALASCARLASERGYDEINLNVGCPSDRVRRGNFGVCLMAEPTRVAAAVSAMRDAVDAPVTVKHRIGFDDHDRFEDMVSFVDIVASAGCDRFVVHARKAWLSGLSPKENREVPPLRYDDVYRLKEIRPDLRIEINGGVRSVDEVLHHLSRVDGVMIGRAAYDDPCRLVAVDREVFGDVRPVLAPEELVRETLPYIEAHLRAGGRLGDVTRHMLSWFSGRPGARKWRRTLSDGASVAGVGPELVLAALRHVERPTAGD